jgi:GMP synthase (glutamine-hydrolysing)
MSFQSGKTSGETVLHFPRGVPAVSAVPSTAKPLSPVLIVLHQETSTPGRIGNALRALGHKLDIRRPRFGDPLPETLDGHAGAVIFGGPMSANDPDDFVRQEIDWIAIPLQEQRPLLGICLGAQMLAMQLGARVAPHPQGRAEIGYYPIRPTPAGFAICPNWPAHVYHWHREGFELPVGAELLAEGGDFPIQAFQSGHAFGFQFHPDVTYAMMHRWTTRLRAARSAWRASAPSSLCRSRDPRCCRARLADGISRWLARPHADAGDVGSRGIARGFAARLGLSNFTDVIVSVQACGF